MSIIQKKREMPKQRRKRSFPHHPLKPHLRKKMKVSLKSHLGKQEDFKTTVLEGMETAKHQVWRAQLSRADFLTTG
jgi:hypothetical protein